MTQTIISVAIFILLLAMLPSGIKWIKGRHAGGLPAIAGDTRVVSAVAVGPHQRVVTVEVGPRDARTWLVLGVTAQSITCLHNITARTGAQRLDADGATTIAEHS